MRPELKAVFENKVWGKGPNVPRSGPGSTLVATAPLRRALPRIFTTYQIKTFVDAPCGDWTWMQHVDLEGIEYFGGDIAHSVIDQNRRSHSRPGVCFDVLDVTDTPLPPSDLFLCRDCLFHLQHWLRWKFFENFAASNGRYLLLTMNHVRINKPLDQNGGFSGFDPRLAPFNLPEPLERVLEIPGHDGTGSGPRIGRSVGLWSHDQICSALSARSMEQGAA